MTPFKKKYDEYNEKNNVINPLTQPGEGVTVFTSPYLSAEAPALGEAKGLITEIKLKYIT